MSVWGRVGECMACVGASVCWIVMMGCTVGTVRSHSSHLKCAIRSQIMCHIGSSVDSNTAND